MENSIALLKVDLKEAQRKPNNELDGRRKVDAKVQELYSHIETEKSPLQPAATRESVLAREAAARGAGEEEECDEAEEVECRTSHEQQNERGEHCGAEREDRARAGSEHCTGEAQHNPSGSAGARQELRQVAGAQKGTRGKIASKVILDRTSKEDGHVEPV